MAHELLKDPVTGRIPLFYYGALPWHGLGQALPDNRPATAAEAIQLAGQHWRVEKYPSYVKIGEGFHPVPDSFDIVRTDTIGVPGVAPVVLTTGGRGVSKDYVPLQNVEAFEFFDSVVGAGQAAYHTVGTIRHGVRTWILAKLPKSITISGMDTMDPYLLLMNSHDGSSAVSVMFTLVRVVCQNTLRMALSNGLREVRVRHTNRTRDKLVAAADLMGIVHNELKVAEDVFGQMATTMLDISRLREYSLQIWPEERQEGVPSAVMRRAREKRLSTLAGLFERGRGADMPSARGTLFGAFSAVTDYVDHYGRRVVADRRMVSTLAGRGDALKQRAFSLARGFLKTGSFFN